MRALLIASVFVLSSFAYAAPAGPAVPDVDDDVEVYSGQVTALSCALQAREKGKLSYIENCPLAEMAKGLVVYDVTEKIVYEISTKNVYRYELEKAAGGGSIDFEGTVAGVKGVVATVDVEEYSVTARPKAGAFKGCL